MPTSKTRTTKKKADKRSGASSVSDFKRKVGGLFMLPSGAKIYLRNPGGLAIFVKDGLVPNSLMPLVQEAIDNQNTQPDMSTLLNDDGGIDGDLMADMMGLMDQVVIQCAVEPPVQAVPENDDDREDDVLYVDEFLDEDKMFIFQWCTGGTADVEQFRREHESELVALSAGEDLA